MEIVVPRIDITGPELLNHQRWVNKYLEDMNRRLPPGGTFMVQVDTAAGPKERILARWPRPLNTLIYTVDYLTHRVWPKLPGLRGLYFAMTKGRDRVMSEMEVIGRLYACGFRLLETGHAGDGRVSMLVEKTGEPAFDPHATYGPLIRLRRVGKGGKMITVYKFRTMSPYSEYIQAYIHERNGYDGEGGYVDDTRITTAGAFMRRYWLDELPMVWNLIKGDLKLFGVRPVSRPYFNMFPPAFQEYRKQFLPGLIPPIVVDRPDTFEDIWLSEKKYLDAYAKAPLRTDLRYCWKAIWNIVVRRVRSS